MSLKDKFTQALACSEGRCDINLFLILWYEGGHPSWKGSLGNSGSECAWLSTAPEEMLMDNIPASATRLATSSSPCWLDSLQLLLAAPVVLVHCQDKAVGESWAQSLQQGRRGRRRWDPLENLQHGSDCRRREVDPSETRLYHSSWSWSSVTWAGISFRKIKKAGGALQLTVPQKLIIKHRFYHLHSMIPLPWWPVWWTHLNFLGPWLACCIAQGIWKIIWMWHDTQRTKNTLIMIR